MDNPFVSYKPILNSELFEKIKKKSLPVSFNLEVTARCNNNCCHCYIVLPSCDREAIRSELTIAKIEDIAKQAVQLGALWCLITGGEPLLRPDFAELYLILKRIGLLVSVFTNATLVNKEHVSLFKKYPPQDIEVTVYGITEKTYEAVTRNKNSFKKFTHGLNLLKEGGVPVRLKAIAMRSNLHEFAAISEFCRRHTKDVFRSDHSLYLRLDGDCKRNAEICNERLTPEQLVTLTLSDIERYSSLQKMYCTCKHKSTYPGDRLFFHCGIGMESFTIGYDGTFCLCSPLRVPGTTYNLHNGDLHDAWDTLVPYIRGLHAKQPELLQECRKCTFRELCKSCPAYAYLEHGSMYSPVDYFCKVTYALSKELSHKYE